MAQLLDGANLNGQKGTNAATPTNPTDLAIKDYVDGQAVSKVVTLTGAGTATAGAFHVITLAASIGGQAITLPSAPPQGTRCSFIRSDTNGFTSFANIGPGAGDTMKEVNPYSLGGNNMGVTFVYVGTSWYVSATAVVGMSGINWSTTSNALGPSVMLRNGSGRSAIADPVGSTDIANKQYVDGRTPSVMPTYAVTHTKPYDVGRNLYNGIAANLFYLRRLIALGKQGGSAKITCIGDSTTAGSGATALTSYPMQWRNMLAAAGCAVRGTGIVYAGQSSGDSRFTATGSVSLASGIYAQMSVGATKTFVSDQSGTEIDIYYFNSSTGQVAWDIDNGTTTGSIVPAGGTTIGKATIGTGLADTTHTVKITASGGTVFWIGVNVHRTTGLQITNAGVPSTTTANWLGTTGVNPFPQAMAETPDLIVVLLGVNDSAGSVAVATYEANLTSIVTACQAIAPVLLVVPVNSSGVTSTAHNPYANAVYNVADALNVAAVDFYDRWNSYFRANTYGLIADSVHPNAAGYAEWADNLFQLSDPGTTQDAGTASVVNGTLVRRDTAGRAQISTPVANNDIANKAYVDGGISAVDTRAQGYATTAANSAVQAAGGLSPFLLMGA